MNVNSHLSDGEIRRLIEEPFALTTVQREHVGACAHCLERQRQARSDRDYVLTAFPAADAEPNLSRARERLRGRSQEPQRLRWLGWNQPRLGQALSGMALAGVIAASVATGTFGSVLSVFQPARVTPIYIERGDLAALPSLRHLGQLSMNRNRPTLAVRTLRQAEMAAGTGILTPHWLPSTMTHQVGYQVVPAQKASFRFDAATWARYARRHHLKVSSMPGSINGSTLSLRTSPATVAVYGPKSEIPDLVIGQTAAPSLTVRGVSVSTVENYLGSLPGVPRSLVDQLKDLSSPTSALPIPIPVNWAYASHVTVQGSAGLLVGDNTGVASVVIWEKAGTVYGVGGSLTSGQVLHIAGSLH